MGGPALDEVLCEVVGELPKSAPLAVLQQQQLSSAERGG